MTRWRACGASAAFWVPRVEHAGGALLLSVALYFLYQGAAATGAVPPGIPPGGHDVERKTPMNTATFRVDGMHCDGCAERIRTLLSKEPGVREVRVSFTEGSAAVRFNPHTVSEARLREVIETGGFNVVKTTA